MIKKILKYVTRGWDNEAGYHHPRAKMFPPFLYDVLSFMMIISIVIGIIKWLLNIV